MTGQLYDAPNQQVVRADGSGPADEGTGGSVAEPQPTGLDAMTKDELVAYADEHEIDVPASGTKSEIRAAIADAEAA